MRESKVGLGNGVEAELIGNGMAIRLYNTAAPETVQAITLTPSVYQELITQAILWGWTVATFKS